MGLLFLGVKLFHGGLGEGDPCCELILLTGHFSASSPLSLFSGLWLSRLGLFFFAVKLFHGGLGEGDCRLFGSGTVNWQGSG